MFSMSDVTENRREVTVFSCMRKCELRASSNSCTENVSFFVSGLAELASRKYKPAAKCFLQASFDHCDCPEVSHMGHVVLRHLTTK